MQEKLENYLKSIYLPTPQYPEKQHGIETERDRLKNNLKGIVEILDIDNMNIAIKNIVTKMMCRFVCSYRSVYSKEYKSGQAEFNIQQTENGFIIISGNESMSISINGDEITIANNCDPLNYNVHGEDYSRCALKINKSTPNLAIQYFRTNSRFEDTYSEATFISTFNDEGLEVEKSFNIDFTEENEKSIVLKGKCERNEFFPVEVSITDCYRDGDSVEEVENVKSVGKKTLPVSSINESTADLNMIFNYSNFSLLKAIGTTSSLINYYTEEKLSYDRLFKYTERQNNAIMNAVTTDVNYTEYIMTSARIDGSYSEEIMENIKKYMNLNLEENRIKK